MSYDLPSPLMAAWKMPKMTASAPGRVHYRDAVGKELTSPRDLLSVQSHYLWMLGTAAAMSVLRCCLPRGDPPISHPGLRRRQRATTVPGHRHAGGDTGRRGVTGPGQAVENPSEEGGRPCRSGLPMSRTACEPRLQAPSACSIVLLTSVTTCRFKSETIKNFKMMTREHETPSTWPF